MDVNASSSADSAPDAPAVDTPLTDDRSPCSGTSSRIAQVSWKEWQLFVLLAFVCLAYFSRLSDLTLRGEETRRGLIAREMLETGDWIIPRTQGVPLFSRPPLQNWIIASLAIIRGDVDSVTLRLPSVCAILLTSILIYRYARLFLQPLGALAAGLAYVSMVQVLELGRMGETDALFTLFVSGALLTWHGGLSKGASLYWIWCVGYALSALGTLTKGPQAPIYFVAPVGLYLLATRKWRVAFSPAHLAGIATFAAVLGTWQVPCVMQVGLEGVKKMYITDVGHRFIDANWFSFGEHLVAYPLELLACLLPWSALLIVWFNRDFRRTLGPSKDFALFLAISLVATFPSVWFPPGSRPRYFMSLYPCLSTLIGLAVQRVALAARSEAWWIVWPIFVRILSMAMVVMGLGFFGISVARVDFWLAQPIWVATLYVIAAGALAWQAWRAVGSRRSPLTALLCIAAFFGISNVSVVMNAMQNSTVDIEGSIAELKKQLPPGTKLISFNVTHHLFTFYYRDTIPVVPWPENGDVEESKAPYFCADVREFENGRDLPFRWRPVTEICCDRHKMTVPRIRVVIGRRQDIPEPCQAATAQADSSANRPHAN